jgi:hypothetical protein
MVAAKSQVETTEPVPTPVPGLAVYRSICAITDALGKDGIAQGPSERGRAWVKGTEVCLSRYR